MRLYDKHGIKMDVAYNKKHSYFERIVLDNNFFQCIKLLNEKESQQIMEEYDNSGRIIKIYYQLIGCGPSSYSEEFSLTHQSSYMSKGETEIIPYKVFPTDIDLSNVILFV